jgi:transcription antitermination protein NusB
MRRSDQRRAAIVALYQHDVTHRPLDELVVSDATSFTREVVAGVQSARPALDELIEANSMGWSLDRIAPLERNILRVALYELLHRTDVPVEVSIDEAVEACKELCGVDAPAFINGVLGAVQKQRMAAW